MAILPVKRVTVCALKKYRKPLLELIQLRGVVEINEALSEDNVFHKSDITSAVTTLNKNIKNANEALTILQSYVPQKKAVTDILKGRTEKDFGFYNSFAKKHDATVNIANKIVAAVNNIAEQKAEILRLQTQIDALEPWTSLDVPVDFSGTKYTACLLGSLPNPWSIEQLYGLLVNFPPLSIEIISTSREQTCIFVLCLKSLADQINDVLRAAGFTYATLGEPAPTEKIKQLRLQVTEAEKEINRSEQFIKESAISRDDLIFLSDYDTMRAEKYEVIGHLLQSNNVFVLTGYIIEKDIRRLENALEKYDAAIVVDEPDKDEEVPVALSNNGFAEPLEGVVESFSMPGKGEVDPTTAMSFFYYMLFGLMLSDAVYGGIIALGCALGLVLFRKTMEASMKNTLKMYFFCGLATVFWGVMFGSYLGDIVDVVSATFFGKSVSIAPLWFFPVKEPMRMLVVAMTIGIVHLFAGLGMKIYQSIKQKDYKSIVYDVIFWYILVISLIIKLLSMKMFTDIFSLEIKIPAVLDTISGIAAIFAAIGIVLTNGRESKNPFKRFLKGLYALYGISSYLSDILSYSRLLALGLATGVIASVVNKMASMTANGPIGFLSFTIVIIFGHTLNLAINALGAYVHTNRLQYVEFFGKFYSGGRRRFKPFKASTKYYKFREE